MRRGRAAVLTAIVMATLAMLVAVHVWQQGREHVGSMREARFLGAVGNLEQGLRRELNGLEAAITAARGFREAAGLVPPQAWARFAASLATGGTKPTFEGLGFAAALPATPAALEALAAAEAPVHAPHAIHLRTAPPSPDGHAILVRVAPLPLAAPILGYDLLSEPVRRAAVLAARDSGQPVISAPLALLTEQSTRRDTLLVQAVYRPGSPPGTPAERRAAFVGVVVITVHLGALFDAAFPDLPPGMAVRITTGSDSARPDLVLEARGEAQPGPEAALASVRQMAVFGQTWTISASGDARFAADLARPPGPPVLLLGALVSLVVGLATWALISRWEKEKAAAEAVAAALAASERRYRALFDRNKAVELLIDPASGAIVDANRAAEAFYGWPREILRTKCIGDINDLGPAGVAAEVANADAEQRNHFQFRHRLANGTLRDVEVFSGPVEVDGSRLLYSIIHDITPRREAEQALEAAESRFRALFDASPLAIQILAPDGRVLRVNRGWETLFGRSSAAAISSGRTAFEDPTLTEAGLIPHLRRAFGGETVDVAAAPLPRPGLGAGPRWVRMAARPLPTGVDGPADARAVIVHYQDITDQRRQERQLATALRDLERAVADLEQFTAVASHDLQEPLQVVADAMAQVERHHGEALPAEARALIAHAAAGTRRMRDLIEDLVAYARIGLHAPAPRAQDTGACLERALAVLEPAVAEAAATITHGPLPPVLADGDDLVRLFEHLVGNALKYRQPDEPPRIHIAAAPAGGLWRFTVADNGLGIPAGQSGRLFTLFQRLHAASGVEGTGVGLATCKKIVERHGGHIGVEATDGHGATFWFTLPVLDTDATT